MNDLIHDLERLTIAPDEVLIVRPKGLLTVADNQRLHHQLGLLADRMGWDRGRILVLDRDFELTVVKAEQMEMTG